MNKLITIFFVFLFSNAAHAACSWVGSTGTAASVSRAEVAACVTDAATKTGNVTINLPAGTATWTSGVTVNMGTASSISIFGNGAIPTGTTKGSAGLSIINADGCFNTFTVDGITSKKWRIANIQFTCERYQTGSPLVDTDCSNAYIKVQGTSRYSAGGGFRIDHNDYITPSNSGGRRRKMWFSGETYGVADHNYAYGWGMFSFVEEGSSGQSANKSFVKGHTLGTADAVFLEDNQPISTNYAWPNYMVMDCYNGGRGVIRYNDITNLYVGGHGPDTTLRGCLQIEAYNNTIRLADATGGNADARFNIRGGTQIIYNNTILETTGGVPSTGQMWAPPIYIRYYRSFSPGSSCTSPWCNPCDNTPVKICAGTLVGPKTTCTTDAQCGGETGSCQDIDGNDNPPNNGWPCRDNIGTAPDGTMGGQMALYPSLFWNNTHNGIYKAPSIPATNNNGLHIQNNRDLCHSSTAMPASCGGIATRYNGQGYAYPHPLTGGADTSAPIVNNTTPSTFECDAESPVSIALTRTTDEAATCRYAVAPETDWADMTQMATTGTTSHSQTLSLACNASYTYNVKCRDSSANESVNSQSDFAISAATTDTTAPVLSNPQPSGSIACGASSPVSKTISLTCTDSVGCTAVKCDTESGIDIDSMDITLSQSGTTWSATVNSLACNAVHTYYCKAEDAANNESASDTTLSFAINPASSVTEAESGTLVAPVSSVSDATASGGYYIKTSTNFQGTATYTVNIPTAGYYQLVGNFNCLDSGEDSWYFAIDGGAQQTWYLGGAYGAWVQRTFGTNQLFSTAGDKSVVFTGREANTKFDWFMFSLLSCAEGQRQYCISQSACEGVGGVWASGVCGDPPVVPAGNAVIRVNSGAGGGNHNASGRIMRPQ